MKLAIVGSGKIVHDFLPITKDLKDTQLVAIVGTQRSEDVLNELKDQYHIQKAYTDYDQALDDPEIDTFYIAVPNFLHYEFAKRHC